ncbi:hypothetical protein AA313_de0204422 [Arthrobotrys entomopaga]|nr:hypothetical protein AA313_de0204422 [Arthrobotrys entomopaga]
MTAGSETVGNPSGFRVAGIKLSPLAPSQRRADAHFIRNLSRFSNHRFQDGCEFCQVGFHSLALRFDKRVRQCRFLEAVTHSHQHSLQRMQCIRERFERAPRVIIFFETLTATVCQIFKVVDCFGDVCLRLCGRSKVIKVIISHRQGGFDLHLEVGDVLLEIEALDQKGIQPGKHASLKGFDKMPPTRRYNHQIPRLL